MNLMFDIKLANNYKNNSQIARVLTEAWVEKNSYCPNCENSTLNSYVNNNPVGDFFCLGCKEDYELKSKDGNLTQKITDGAYSKMIERITSEQNPNFFFLTYSKLNFTVNNFLIIPKYFFVPNIIEERKPLSATAKRAGWIGCNIDLKKIPELGKIFLIKNGECQNSELVRENWKKTLFLKQKSLNIKGWTLDILNCIDRISSSEFTLNDIYNFESILKTNHPENNFIKDKIRQQLQILRNLNIIEFNGKGTYRKI